VVTVPAAVAAAHQHYWLAWAAGLYVAGAALAGSVGNSRRLTAAGRAALKRWRSAVAAAAGDGQVPAYAAALGGAPAALAVFAPGRKNTAWTSYRGGWQQLEIETGTWSWQWGDLAWLAHRATPPPFAEFDDQVIRQWIVKGDSDSPDEYRVAVDDGTRETAWDFDVGSERYRRLTPGTFVHVRVNLRDRADLAVAPVEPPANGKHMDGGPGRSMVWQHAKTTRPMLRVEIRYAADARPVPPGAWRVARARRRRRLPDRPGGRGDRAAADHDPQRARDGSGRASQADRVAAGGGGAARRARDQEELAGWVTGNPFGSIDFNQC
jgi:hypothetical protein